MISWLCCPQNLGSMWQSHPKGEQPGWLIPTIPGLYCKATPWGTGLNIGSSPKSVFPQISAMRRPPLTLHVDDQQRVADGERRPEADGLRRGEEIAVDEGDGGQVGHGEGDDQGFAQQPGDAVAGGEEQHADAAVALPAVQLVEAAGVECQAPGVHGQQPRQPRRQRQVARPVGSPFQQEAEAAGHAAAQRVLAQQEKLAAVGALREQDGAVKSCRGCKATREGAGAEPCVGFSALQPSSCLQQLQSSNRKRSCMPRGCCEQQGDALLQGNAWVPPCCSPHVPLACSPHPPHGCCKAAGGFTTAKPRVFSSVPHPLPSPRVLQSSEGPCPAPAAPMGVAEQQGAAPLQSHAGFPPCPIAFLPAVVASSEELQQCKAVHGFLPNSTPSSPWRLQSIRALRSFLHAAGHCEH